jgi:hypothetical protein
MDGLIPTALAIASAVQCVASRGGAWFGQGNNTTAFTALAAAGHPVPPEAIGDALADANNAEQNVG